jgi:uncharacterized membrane protein YphA (DoxX/SURF4 family)
VTSEILTGTAALAGPVLMLVFAASAIAKLRRPAATRQAFARLGVPMPGLAARLVPFVEVALCALLVIAPRPAAAMALALLAVFTLVLLPAAASNRSAGTDGFAPVTCGCFGSASAAPVSPVEIVRNAVIMAAAALAAAAGPSELGSGLRTVTLADIVSASTAILIVTVALQLLALKRDIGSIWGVRLAGEALPASSA